MLESVVKVCYMCTLNICKYFLLEPCIDESIRLNSVSLGLPKQVEVCINNTWYTVCNYHWTNTEASVVCSQLGYSPYG